MREITQVEQFNLRGVKVVEKIKSVIKSGEAREILIEDDRGDIMFKISPDRNFLQPTLDMVRGVIKVIKRCKLVVLKNQLILFGNN